MHICIWKYRLQNLSPNVLIINQIIHMYQIPIDIELIILKKVQIYDNFII